MKGATASILGSFSLIMISLGLFAQGGWEWQNPLPQGNTLNSVFFADTNTGYAVGRFGTIIKTIDGGTSWTEQLSRVPYDLTSVYFTDANTGYAVGYSGIILKTVDGGFIWSCQLSGTTDKLFSVFFNDANTGYAVGGNGGYYGIGRILKTVDGGTTWTNLTSQTPNMLKDVYFVDANTGYAVGGSGTIIKTVDAGTTWTALSSGTTNYFSSVDFTDPNTGYAVGGSGTIVKTINGGITWTELSSGITSSLTSIYFTDTITGYAVGNSPGIIIKTIDKGVTWSVIYNGISSESELNSVMFPNPDAGIVVGYAGTLLKTINSGATWSAILNGSTKFLRSIYFVDSEIGYVVGDWGTMLKSTNGGSNWSQLNSGTLFDLSSVFFTNANTGYVVGGNYWASWGNGIILQTTNGGINWTNISGGTISTLNSIYFCDGFTGYAAGWNGSILKTTNGGTTWTSLLSGTSAELRSVYFPKADTGYVVGDSGIILKTINGGLSWNKLSSGTNNPLTSVYFINAITGYAVGAGWPSGTILKTIDGGVTWNALQGATGTTGLSHVYFADANTGYATGSTMIEKTIDGGLSWNNTTTENVSHYNSLWFTDLNTGYTAGSWGTIMKTTTGGAPKVYIKGTLTNSNGSPVSGGSSVLFDNSSSYGGYDTTTIAPITNGTFMTNTAANNPSLLLAMPDNSQFPNLLPTYYGDTVYWKWADTLITAINLNAGTISFRQKPPALNGNATINGTVISQVINKANDPIDNVGVIIKKTTSQSISGYTRTDAAGSFSFNNVEIGTYKIYIDYTGIPMYEINGDNAITITHPDTIIQITARVDSNFIWFSTPGLVPPVYTVHDENITSGQSGCYNALQTLAVAGTAGTVNINAGGSAYFVAGQRISFQPGLTVQSGGNLWGHITTTSQYCSQLLASNLSLGGMTITNSENNCYQAMQTLSIGGGGSTFQLLQGGFVHLIAGQKIRMLPNTKVISGAYLHAYISADGEYCNNPKSADFENEENAETKTERGNSKDQNTFFKVYPNPTSGTFTLELSSDPGESTVSVMCFDMVGSLIMKKEYNKGIKHELSLDGHVPGVYLLRVMMNGETGIKKIIKQ